MNKIKNIAFSALLAIGTFGIVTFTACTKDECKDVVCQNGGTCVSGACSCATGYEGTNCEKETRAKFIKTWNASDVAGTSSPLIYTVGIGSGVTITGVIISNAFNDNFFVNNVSATVNGDQIVIADQSPDADDYRVAGSGTITNGKISWSYTITKTSTSQVLSYNGVWQ